MRKLPVPSLGNPPPGRLVFRCRSACWHLPHLPQLRLCSPRQPAAGPAEPSPSKACCAGGGGCRGQRAGPAGRAARGGGGGGVCERGGRRRAAHGGGGAQGKAHAGPLPAQAGRARQAPAVSAPRGCARRGRSGCAEMACRQLAEEGCTSSVQRGCKGVLYQATTLPYSTKQKGAPGGAHVMGQHFGKPPCWACCYLAGCKSRCNSQLAPLALRVAIQTRGTPSVPITAAIMQGLLSQRGQATAAFTPAKQVSGVQWHLKPLSRDRRRFPDAPLTCRPASRLWQSPPATPFAPCSNGPAGASRP